MQALRKLNFNPVFINKQLVRSVAVNSAIETEEGLQLKSWTEIPGPPRIPLLGQFHHFLPGGELYNTKESLIQILYKKYGPIVKLDGHFGSEPVIFLYDAEACSTILRNENWLPVRPGIGSLNYYRKVYSKSRDDPVDAPTGLLSDHGDIWKKFRSTVNPIMLQPKTIKLYSTALSEVAEDMIKRMRQLRNDENILECNFDVEMNLWALESIGVVALGGRLDCLNSNLAEDSPARKLIKVVHDIFDVAQEIDLKPSLWRYFSTPGFKRAMQTYEDQITLSKYFIDRATEQFKTKNKKSDEEKGVLEKLLEIDESVAIIMASDMLLAGVDTAANTMTATLYLLASNPEKQQKLREEIMSDEIKRPYLKACLKESMRILPVVGGNTRRTSKQYHLLGYKIPKDINVRFGHQLLSSMEEQYPRPKEYVPERWIADKDDPLFHGNAHPFAYSPFGFGARSCIGRRIAELEIETFLSKVIENFQVEWFGPPLKIKPITLNYTQPPFNFIFKDVK